LRRSQLKYGDILFSIAGALGRTAFVIEEILPANTNQALAIIRLKNSPHVFPKFILKALQSGLVLGQIDRVKGGVAQQNLSLAQVGEFQIPLPPLPEQHRIVGLLDEAFAGIATAEAQAQQKLAALDALKQSLLHQAFSGTL
jgi:type I restriction enzyme S subunit